MHPALPRSRWDLSWPFLKDQSWPSLWGAASETLLQAGTTHLLLPDRPVDPLLLVQPLLHALQGLLEQCLLFGLFVDVIFQLGHLWLVHLNRHFALPEHTGETKSLFPSSFSLTSNAPAWEILKILLCTPNLAVSLQVGENDEVWGLEGRINSSWAV